MEVIAPLAAWALRAACDTSLWGYIPLCYATVDIASLSQKLSADSEVLIPGSDAFKIATARWSGFNAPDVKTVVVPATEGDVAETIKYANQQNIPFLAVTSGHGAISTQGKMKHGVEIWMNKLKSVSIAADGQTATFGGGLLSKEVTDALWEHNKQTVTGFCECTSLVGVGLGGGHGPLQGRYGLISDQFVNMNVILADGSIKTIDHRSDLWWAMQGAGHNFGIVTSLTSKIYDIEHRNWSYKRYIFTGDKVESLFQRINDIFVGKQPADIMHHAFLLNNPDIAPAPVIMLWITQEGVNEVDPSYTVPIDEMGPVHTHTEITPYNEIPGWIQAGMEDLACQKKSETYLRFPIDLKRYNATAQQQLYDTFAAGVKTMPELGNSMVLIEGYGVQAVQAVPEESTAFPFRSDDLLIAPFVYYKPNGSALDEKAKKFGETMRSVLHEGSGREKIHAYVNYAYGDEELGSVYGEDWRLKKLRTLKKHYDPNGRFNFYAPIN